MKRGTPSGRLAFAAIVCLVLVVLGLPSSSTAKAPAVLARADRSLWPDPMLSRADFDRASRAEQLVFARALSAALDRDAPGPSVRRYAGEVQRRLRAGVQAARDTCTSKADLGCAGSLSNFDDLLIQGEALERTLPARYARWLAMAQAFHRDYVTEQLRLAGLFPRTTSEILRFGDHELDGADWEDAHFLLTFDDGPTAEGGGTDALIASLDQQHAAGLFFATGRALDKRIARTSLEKVRSLYATQCLGSHGATHVSHQHLDAWRESITTTRDLIWRVRGADSDVVPFRPPYGQRTAEAATFARAEHAPVVLWNIDSQDWTPLSPEEVEDRVATLMLLWRRGVILFHDTHKKALGALSGLLALARASKLTWVDCRNVASPR